jgi:tellurite resistance protein TerC
MLHEVSTMDWFGFGVFVVVVLILDLFVFHRDSREATLRESAIWTIIWCSLALAFNGLIWYRFGGTAAIQFLTGYLVEWSLSMDNVFVFAVVFGYFMVPLKYQYRVLFWGILGAIVMRLTFILLGAELIDRWHWILYFFGVFLIFTGIKLALHKEDEAPDLNKKWILRVARRFLRISHENHGEKFFVRENGLLCATPLFLVLLVIETTDVMFAIDSVPAIFAITREPYIVFTSNIFAILGLRALYFLLAGVIDMFRYLNYGLSAVLVFVGIKMLLPESIHLPDWASLAIIALLLGGSIVASIIAKKLEGPSHAESATKPENPALPPTTGEEPVAADRPPIS